MTSQITAAVPLYLQSHVFLVTKSRGLWGGGSSGDENKRNFKVSNQPETSGYPEEASHSTPLHDCSYPLFWLLYGYYPVKWTDHSSYGKEIWQIRKTKQKQRIEKTSSDNAKLNTSLLSCLQESLQKEQRYKTWKSISSIYRRHHILTQTRLETHLSSLTGDTLLRTRYTQKQTGNSTGGQRYRLVTHTTGLPRNKTYG